jgi:hypothetical protein
MVVEYRRLRSPRRYVKNSGLVGGWALGIGAGS